MRQKHCLNLQSPDRCYCTQYRPKVEASLRLCEEKPIRIPKIKDWGLFQGSKAWQQAHATLALGCEDTNRQTQTQLKFPPQSIAAFQEEDQLKSQPYAPTPCEKSWWWENARPWGWYPNAARPNFMSGPTPVNFRGNLCFKCPHVLAKLEPHLGLSWWRNFPCGNFEWLNSAVCGITAYYIYIYIYSLCVYVLRCNKVIFRNQWNLN